MTFESKTTTLSGLERPRERLVVRVLNRIISQIDFGQITVVLPSGDRIQRSGASTGPSAMLVLNRWRAIGRLISQGDLEAPEFKTSGRDEIATLSDSFSRMRASVVQAMKLLDA